MISLQDADENVLYHYCDGNAFQNIVEKQQLWLSSLALSNDSMEGKLSESRLDSVIKAQALSPDISNRLLEMWRMFNSIFEVCGTCLSSEGDLLSQWRGYANNGAGFSIGFKEQLLRKLPVPLSADEKLGPLPGDIRPTELHEVLYKHEEQLGLMRELYDQMSQHLASYKDEKLTYSLIDTSSLKAEIFAIDAQSKVGDTMSAWIGRAFSIKGEAFAEEKETRIVNVAPRFSRAFYYRARSNTLVPYLKQPLMLPGQPSPIAEVILGPLNRTPVPVIQAFLAANGLDGVTVSQSLATYQG